MTILRETEEQLASFTPAKRWMVTAVAAVMIVAGGWLFWIEDIEAGIEQAELRKLQLARQVAQVNLRALSAKIERVRQKRYETAKKAEEIEIASKFLRTKLERISKIRFDQKRVADLLDGVLGKSVDLGIRIEKIESLEDRASVTPLLERKRRVVVHGSGNFADIAKLAYFIESLEMLAKISRLYLALDDKGETLFSMEIETYGVIR